ncbi:right-handed parallel beta-helix repeat-containing protein [Halorubrum sp. Eb13]|uniref:right-handed parallel beta-helix repeat-containing protein n=1 Tax=Halorubrum sp. Eb13 TaxID=1383843 RepID=UPI0011402C67|nr:right-handed parallel beta-helix repeat-containing protein [Halorubrum sp. Eb13]
MADIQPPDLKITRRKALALISAGGLGAVAGLFHLTKESDPTTNNAGNANESDYIEAESIKEHGGIEGDPSIEAAEANVTAIHQASVASNENTVYLPEGEWYVGHRDTGVFLYPGDPDADRGAAGLSFVGEGPAQSFLTVAPEISGTSENIVVRYSKKEDHHNVEWSGLTYDGNENELDLPVDRSQWGLHLRGSGAFRFENVRFRNFHANGILGSASGGYSIDINRCSFYRIAIGRHNNMDGEVVGHHLGLTIDSDQHLTVRNTMFELVSGTCLDLNPNSRGPVIFNNCWARGCGDAFIKVNGGGTTRISQLYFQGTSSELTNALETEPGLGEHHGRNFIYRLDGDKSNLPEFILNDIEASGMPYHAIQVRRGLSMAIEGGKDGPIVLSDIAGYEDFHGALRDDDDKESRFDFDIGELSVHGTVGNVFRAPSSVGSINMLNRDRNGGLGDTGNISIKTDNQGAEPFDPVTPSRDEVGVITVADDVE